MDVDFSDLLQMPLAASLCLHYQEVIMRCGESKYTMILTGIHCLWCKGESIAIIVIVKAW